MSRDFTSMPTRRAVLAGGVASLILPTPLLAQGAAAPVKIGIIGSGKIGSTLGTLWVKAGHPVLFSSRHPEELKDLIAGLGPLAKAGTPDEAVAFGEVVLVAVPYKAYPQIGQDLGKAMASKIVLDAGNATERRDGEQMVAETRNNGIGMTSAKYFPGAKLVRAFNALPATVLAREAHRSGALVAMPIAGDDKDALSAAAKLVADAGFEAVVVGGLDRSKDFAMGAPGYGQVVTAPELKTTLGLPR